MRRWILAVALVAGAAPRAHAQTCSGSIPPSVSQRMFDGLRRVHMADGCTIEDVRTDRDVMEVTVLKGGAAEPPLRLVPSPCRRPGDTVGPSLAAFIPPETATACPLFASEARALVQSIDLGTLASEGGEDEVITVSDARRARGSWAAAALSFAICLAVAILALARRSR